MTTVFLSPLSGKGKEVVFFSFSVLPLFFIYSFIYSNFCGWHSCVKNITKGVNQGNAEREKGEVYTLEEAWKEIDMVHL